MSGEWKVVAGQASRGVRGAGIPEQNAARSTGRPQRTRLKCACICKEKWEKEVPFKGKQQKTETTNAYQHHEIIHDKHQW